MYKVSRTQGAAVSVSERSVSSEKVDTHSPSLEAYYLWPFLVDQGKWMDLICRKGKEYEQKRNMNIFNMNSFLRSKYIDTETEWL